MAIVGEPIPPEFLPKNRIAHKLLSYRRLTLNFVDWNRQISNFDVADILAVEAFIERDHVEINVLRF
jgi:hypothetical protein